jgi:hypothetical protein
MYLWEKEVKPISSTQKYIERGKTDIINTQITECSKSNILNTQITVRSKTDILNKQIIERDKTEYRFYFFLCICVLKISVYLFLCICMLRISVLTLSMILCAENIGFTSLKPISSTHKYIERGKTDILNTQIHRKR